jgi:isopentenyl phosphate kinase
LPPRSMLLVKLGGSVITDKSRLRTARPSVLRRLAREVSATKEQIVLVHGAGSFGHILAKRYRLHEGYRDESQLRGVSEVQRDVRRLNLMVDDALLRAGLKPMPIPPSIVARFGGGRLHDIDVKPFIQCLGLGMTPVTFGDVVFDSERRFGICSGDDLIGLLHGYFPASKTILVTDVDGVFTSDPKKKGKRELLREVRIGDLGRLSLSVRAGKDVTGGIEGKLRKMFKVMESGDEFWILNGLVPGRLSDAIKGKRFIGTRVVA